MSKLVSKSIKFDPEILALAEKKGLSVADIAREAVNKEVKTERCSHCGQLKKKK